MKIVFWFDYIEEDGRPINNARRWNRNIIVPANVSDQVNSILHKNGVTARAEIPLIVRNLLGNDIIEFKKISPDAYVDPDANYNLYWIDAPGDSDWGITHNLFSNIPISTLKFLNEQQIAIIINSSYETDNRFLHHVSYRLPIIRGQQQLYGLDNIKVVLLIAGDSYLADQMNAQWCDAGDHKKTVKAVAFNHFYFETLFSLPLIPWNFPSLRGRPEVSPRNRFKANDVSTIPVKPILAALGSSKNHRIMIYQEMVNSGLIPRSNTSLFITASPFVDTEWVNAHNNQCTNPDAKITFDLTTDKVFDCLSHDEVYGAGAVYGIDPDIMHSTVLQIVGETWVEHGGFSEKTMKCFAWGHIPLIFGGPGLIELLVTRFGFKFIPEFSYRYDNRFHSPQERMELFREEIKKLKNYTNEDLRDLYIKNLDIIEHNQQVVADNRVGQELLIELNNMFAE